MQGLVVEGGILVAEIKVGKNETLDSALRRFKRSCQKSGVLSECRKREHYENLVLDVKRNQRQREKIKENLVRGYWNVPTRTSAI